MVSLTEPVCPSFLLLILQSVWDFTMPGIRLLCPPGSYRGTWDAVREGPAHTFPEDVPPLPPNF